jgi:hypothetical protein
VAVRKDWARWDNEIEGDSQAGSLDFLEREAREGKAKSSLKRGAARSAFERSV